MTASHKSSAWVEEQITKRNRIMKDCDLSGADLRGAYLPYVDLVGANLTDVTLEEKHTHLLPEFYKSCPDKLKRLSFNFRDDLNVINEHIHSTTIVDIANHYSALAENSLLNKEKFERLELTLWHHQYHAYARHLLRLLNENSTLRNFTQKMKKRIKDRFESLGIGKLNSSSDLENNKALKEELCIQLILDPVLVKSLVSAEIWPIIHDFFTANMESPLARKLMQLEHGFGLQPADLPPDDVAEEDMELTQVGAHFAQQAENRLDQQYEQKANEQIPKSPQEKLNDELDDYATKRSPKDDYTSLRSCVTGYTKTQKIQAVNSLKDLLGNETKDKYLAYREKHEPILWQFFSNTRNVLKQHYDTLEKLEEKYGDKDCLSSLSWKIGRITRHF